MFYSIKILLMRAAVILNKNAGLKKEEYSIENITKTFKKFNIYCEIYLLQEKDISEIIKDCIEKKFEVIVAGGGDGTISSVASEIKNSDTILGILPLGTLNHFAKDNNIPIDLEEAVKIISEKKIKEIDTGEVNGVTFINNSSIGIYPKVVKQRDKQLKRFGGNKWIAMLIAFFDVLRRFSSYEVDVHSEREKIKTKTPFIFIGNNDYKTDLFNLGRREKLDEGYLSLYLPNTSGFFSIIHFIFYALTNTLEQVKDFSIIKTKEITIDLKKRGRKKTEISIDGEVFHLKSPLDYKIMEKSLKIIVPER